MYLGEAQLNTCSMPLRNTPSCQNTTLPMLTKYKHMHAQFPGLTIYLLFETNTSLSDFCRLSYNQKKKGYSHSKHPYVRLQRWCHQHSSHLYKGEATSLFLLFEFFSWNFTDKITGNHTKHSFFFFFFLHGIMLN